MTTRPFLESGPLPLLASSHSRAVVAGGVLQPWKLSGGRRPPSLDAAELEAFSEPGWVKCAIDFRLTSDGRGTRLSTETRTRATDPRTRLKFGIYWLFIRAGSGVIRREMLRVVAQLAEATAGPRAPVGRVP